MEFRFSKVDTNNQNLFIIHSQDAGKVYRDKGFSFTRMGGLNRDYITLRLIQHILKIGPEGSESFSDRRLRIFANTQCITSNFMHNIPDNRNPGIALDILLGTYF